MIFLMATGSCPAALGAPPGIAGDQCGQQAASVPVTATADQAFCTAWYSVPHVP